MKKKFIGIAGAVCALALGAMLTACNNGTAKYERYDMASMYTVGEANFAVTQISGIEVDWFAGEVNIVVSETATEIAVDDSRDERDDLAMRYYIDRGTLEIKFAKSGVKVPADLRKTLTITLPASGMLGDIEVDTVAADVKAEGLSAREVTADTVSGSVTLTGISAAAVTADTVSGNILIDKCTFAEGDAETTSGNAVFVLGEIDGFTLEYRSASGQLNSAYAMTSRGRDYTYGNGRVELSFESTSGDLDLRKE